MIKGHITAPASQESLEGRSFIKQNIKFPEKVNEGQFEYAKRYY